MSHLFLPGSKTPDVPPPPGETALEPPAGRPARAGVGVLRPGSSVTKDQLIATLLEYPDALEPGLRALGPALPCGTLGEIDLLAVDRASRLVVVDVETTVADRLLLRAMSHGGWASRSIALLQRMYQPAAIDAVQRPRLVLVAPRYSEALSAAVRQLTIPAVSCFRYHAVAIHGGTGILFEQLRDEDAGAADS